MANITYAVFMLENGDIIPVPDNYAGMALDSIRHHEDVAFEGEDEIIVYPYQTILYAMEAHESDQSTVTDDLCEG